jgi:hypothetical protein
MPPCPHLGLTPDTKSSLGVIQWMVIEINPTGGRMTAINMKGMMRIATMEGVMMMTTAVGIMMVIKNNVMTANSRSS